jgi:hypothetical protein
MLFFFLKLYNRVFQQPDVLFGRGAKPGHTILHQFYPIAIFTTVGERKMRYSEDISTGQCSLCHCFYIECDADAFGTE